MFYIFSVEIDELLLAGCITLDFSDISCWWTKSPVQCRVFCLILKLECDACVTKALRADLLRNWIIRAPASVRDHLVTKCHSGDHHHQWSVTCDQWEAELGTLAANQRPRDTRDSICQSRDIMTMVTSGQHPGAARVTTALWRCHAPRHGDTLCWHLGHCQECYPCCVSLSAGLVSVTQTFTSRRRRVYCNALTETIRLAWTSICLNPLRQTDEGIEPAVLGIFAVQCNPTTATGQGFVVFIHYLQEALSRNLNSEISVCTDNTYGG